MPFPEFLKMLSVFIFIYLFVYHLFAGFESFAGVSHIHICYVKFNTE